jgi:flavin reductase (DIM6/NTAB) family NADH-FMN oxidoreductase RutF
MSTPRRQPTVRQLTALWSHMHHPAAIVTARSRSGHARAGCLVGLHTQCSIDPLRALVCLSKANRTHDVANSARCLTVHYPLERDRPIAVRFGTETGYTSDSFEAVDWTSDGDAVVLCAIDHRWRGSIVDTIDLGDHTGFVLDPTDLTLPGAGEEADFLDMADLADVTAGHERSPG